MNYEWHENLGRAQLAVSDREEMAVLAFAWCQVMNCGCAYYGERAEEYDRFVERFRAQPWYSEAVSRLKARDLWPEDAPWAKD